MIRVTENTNFDTVRESIRRSKGRMEELQGQSATLKKLNRPSDNPVGSAKVLEVRTEKVNNDQFQMNAKMAATFLENSDHALSEISDILVRAKEIAIGQSSGASANEDTRLGVSEEINQLYLQAVATANRRIGDRHLFGGYKTNRPPIDNDGQYVGDNGQMMVEIARDVFVSMNIPGIEAFNTVPKSAKDAEKVYPELSTRKLATVEGGQTFDATDPPAGLENVNVFDELQNLRISLLTGNLEGIRNTLERLDQIHGKVVSVRSKLGSRLQGILSTNQAIERHNLTNAELTSQLEDADMAQVVSDLAKEETVLRSTLACAQKLIKPTLMDFIR
jgi:flagellar hook-associated protein 3 FlgL